MWRAIAVLVMTASGCAHPAPSPIAPPPAHPELPPELVLTFTDRMGSTYELVQAQFTLDGQPVYDRTCAEEEAACRASFRTAVAVYTAQVGAGTHRLDAHVVFRGNGTGIFSYIRAYRFDVRSHHDAPAEFGRRTLVDAVAVERGGPTTPLEERPTLEWNGRWTNL